MRIKSDYVTNSSAASFIIVDGGGVLHIAEEMIKYYISENIRDRFEYATEYLDQESIMLKRINEIFETDPASNILIPNTCNYETWIYWLREPFNLSHVKVDTCNNHDWLQMKKFNNSNVEHLSENSYYDYDKKQEFVNILTGEKKKRCQFNNERWKNLNVDDDCIDRGDKDED